jgi:hypothetical protein
MKRNEAAAIADQHLRPYRARTYDALLTLLQHREFFEGRTDTGDRYSGVVYALWDDRPQGNLRVWADVSWGGHSDFAPVTQTFIIAPDGSFVGE